MSESSPCPRDSVDVRQLANAVRFVLAAIVVGLSILSLRSSLAIDGFERIFQDMLGGRPLPALTVFILEARLAFVVVTAGIPVVAVATLMFQNVVRAIYILGALGFLSVVATILLTIGLTGALFEILKLMGSGPG